MTDVAYFDGLEGERRATALALRAALDEGLPDATVKLAWGHPCWVGGTRIASIIAHSAHVNLQLWSGARLADRWPDRIEGTGKGLRHVKLRAAADVDAELSAIIDAAAALDRNDPRPVR